MGKAIKYSLLGAIIGAGAVAARSLSVGQAAPADSDSQPAGSTPAMPAKAAKGAACGALAGGLVGVVFDRRGKRKLKKRNMKLASMAGAGVLVEAARSAKPAIGKQSRRARKAAMRAAKDARRAGRRTAKRVGRRATHTAELARLQADHLVDVGRHKLAS
jgi:hypothetical protein